MKIAIGSALLILLASITGVGILDTSKTVGFLKPTVTSDKDVAEDKDKDLKKLVEENIGDSKDDYSIVIKNLSSDLNFVLNEHKPYEAGSLYKLWVMACVYNQIKSGVLNKDEVLSESIPTLNAKFGIDPNNAELSDGYITLTVEEALNQMITISHNYSALLLTEKIGLQSMADFLKDNGFKESSVRLTSSPPQTSAYDTALFFEKLYKGELNDATNTVEMLNLLKNQKLNGGIPKYLPQDLQVAHKTGDIGYFKHDVGIVYDPKGDYIISILSETPNPAAAQEKIANLSKDVYKALTS